MLLRAGIHGVAQTGSAGVLITVWDRHVLVLRSGLRCPAFFRLGHALLQFLHPIRSSLLASGQALWPRRQGLDRNRGRPHGALQYPVTAVAGADGETAFVA